MTKTKFRQSEIYLHAPTHQNDEDADKNSSKISEEGQGMLHIVQIPEVGPFNDLLGVYHHVSQKYQ